MKLNESFAEVYVVVEEFVDAEVCVDIEEFVVEYGDEVVIAKAEEVEVLLLCLLSGQ